MKDSLPSVVLSAAVVSEKDDLPDASTWVEPRNPPEEKSSELIPNPVGE